MTAAIYYQPEAYSISGPKLMGRNAAGESFLRGFLAYSNTDKFWVQVKDAPHAEHFAQIVTAAGRSEPVAMVDKYKLAELKQPGVVYHPGPGLGTHAWQRAEHQHSSWSLCGITHTTSSERIMDALAELLTAPIQPWDAVICTSTAVKDNVQRVLQAQADYLKERLGISRLVLPQLPVIPLGIHTSDFVFGVEQKQAARKTLGINVDTLVVLFMGRLSFHAKAHPLAMYQALEQAAQKSGKSVVLVECGWHANEFIADAFAEAARMACPSVRVVTMDGRRAEERQTAWASADVFCSLSDNIQETFGIVPIEAMAASLPVVVSDWDGYKDTVRDEIDGFRIPTLMPGVGLGADLALRHALGIDSYDMYCGHTSSLVAVDVQAAVRAFVSLFKSPELRQQMGNAGRERARSLYDWSVIIRQYEALWAQLAQIRQSTAAYAETLSQIWPARLDPFQAYAVYPTRLLTQQTMFALVDNDANSALARIRSYRKLTMVNFAQVVLPAEEEVQTVLQMLESGPGTAADLVSGFSPGRRPFVFRTLVWLVKMHVLQVLEP